MDHTEKMQRSNSIHLTLAHSYLAYYLCSIVGLFVDTFIGFTVETAGAARFALIFFIIGTLLILWAQVTSRRYKHETESSPYFLHGPYRFVRNPTHLGIVLLVSGYTFVSGSLVFFGITVLGYLVSNVFFKRYEAILDRAYGDDYKRYQASVPRVL